MGVQFSFETFLTPSLFLQGFMALIQEPIQKIVCPQQDPEIELVSKELNHLAAILHVYAGGLNFMK